MGIVVSLDAQTGCTYWHSKPGGSIKTAVMVDEIASDAATLGTASRCVACYVDTSGMVHAETYRPPVDRQRVD